MSNPGEILSRGLGKGKGRRTGKNAILSNEERAHSAPAKCSEHKKPRRGPGGRLLGGLFGLGDGLGDAGDEALGEGDGTLEGAAGVGAGDFQLGDGDEVNEDAFGGIAGGNGDAGGGGGVGVVFWLVFIVFLCFGLFALHQKSAGANGTCRWGGPWE